MSNQVSILCSEKKRERKKKKKEIKSCRVQVSALRKIETNNKKNSMF